MARSQPNLHLRELVAEAELTGEALARAVNRAAAENDRVLRYTRKTVARWLAGSRPPAPVPALVAEILTRRLGRSVTVHETGLAAAADDQGAPVIVPRGSARAALSALTAADTDPRSRAEFRNAPFRLSNTPPAWTDEPSAAPRPHAAGHWRIGSGELAALQHATSYYADTMNVFGGAHGRTALAAYLASDAAAYLTADAPGEVRDQLLGHVSRLTHLLARMCVDCGQNGAAQHYFNAAAQLAIEARDRTLYAITLRAVSAQLHQLGLRRTDLAEAPLGAAPEDTPPTIRAFLLTHLAVAHAATGAAGPALRALSDAEALCGRETGAGQDPFAGYPLAALCYQRGQVHQMLGDFSAAASALSSSLRLRAAGAHRSRALTLARLTEVLLLGGQVEKACTAADRLLDQYGRIRCPRTARKVRDLRTHMLPHARQPAVRSVVHRLDRYTAHSALARQRPL